MSVELRPKPGFLFILVTSALAMLVPSNLNMAGYPADVLAQGQTCPNMVRTALALTNKECSTTGRNKACYGNVALDAEPQLGVADFKFGAPGDVVDVSAIRVLRLSAVDVNAKTWGIVLLRIQADLPDTAPGQNVTLMMFGDVALAEDVQAILAPSAQSTPEPTAAATSTATPVYKPMQAFYFRSGIGAPACKEAPRDGILIQSPKGKSKVTLVVNEVKITLGSTIFVQAQPGGPLTINVIEGQVQIEAAGQQVTAAAGTQVRVPLNGSLKAAGVPTAPEPYSQPRLQTLPVRNLPVVVPIAQPQVAQIGKGSTGCSIVGNTTTSITFTNNRDRPVAIYWVSYQCAEVLYKTLGPGTSYVQQTFVTHPWRIRDAETGALLKQLVADGSVSAASVP